MRSFDPILLLISLILNFVLNIYAVLLLVIGYWITRSAVGMDLKSMAQLSSDRQAHVCIHYYNTYSWAT